MRYLIGDILLNFRTREIFIVEVQNQYIFEVLANSEETRIFKKEFLSKGILRAKFAEFKLFMPEFNAKSFRNRIYGKISIDENLYLSLRRLQKSEPFHRHCKSFEDVISTLINLHLTIKDIKTGAEIKKEMTSAIDSIKESLVKIEKNIA
ncbi:MAG: hypothetical protein JXR53_06855 [Bacteroidales bacterium]|nr:hypothetical protein [Bacteroidales bacterium]